MDLDKIKSWANEIGYNISEKTRADSQELDYFWSSHKNPASTGISPDLIKLVSDIYYDKTFALHQHSLLKNK